MKCRESETFSRPDILGLTGTETSTKTRKVSVPKVSALRVPISDLKFVFLFSFLMGFWIMVPEVAKQC